jgi:hypothetical protein
MGRARQREEKTLQVLADRRLFARHGGLDTALGSQPGMLVQSPGLSAYSALQQ